jgi:MFS family permease
MVWKTRSVAGNTRALNIFSFWFCLRFFAVVAVLYFAHVTHSYTLAVSVLVVTRVAQGVFEVPTGVLSDRWGRVWCLRLGVGGKFAVGGMLRGGARVLVAGGRGGARGAVAGAV